MNKLTVFQPEAVASDAHESEISEFTLQFLAGGDSWFSIGNNPFSNPNGNLLDGISTTIAACAVNCAYPGDKLERMVDGIRRPRFNDYLASDRQWGGLLVSGGGNDLIEAAQLGPGQPAHKRIFATPDERAGGSGAQRYLSNTGWATFSQYLEDVVAELVARRDATASRGVPIFMHTYDYPTPRPSGAGLGSGPWLYPAVLEFQIPEEDWLPVATALLQRLRTLLHAIAHKLPDGSLHIVDTQGHLRPAGTADTGATADWRNEIHPSLAGYETLGALWPAVIDPVYAGRFNEVAAGN